MLSTEELLGSSVGSYVGFTTEPGRRENAASGGVVGAITEYLLETGKVSMVLASRLTIADGKLHPEGILARTVDELRECRNSIYLDYQPGGSGRFHKIMDEIAAGRNVAVVGLYCHLNQLYSLMKKRGLPRERVLTIGLFCSHAPDRKLITKVLERQGADLSRAVAYHTKTGEGGRDGRLYARSTVEYEDGTKLDFPYIEFTAYKNSWLYTPKKCLVCPDQFSESADISCGDAWYREVRKHPFKQTTVITRNERADKLIRTMVREGRLELRTLDPASIVRSQRRVAGHRASLAARADLAKRWGMKLPQSLGRIRFRDRLHSWMILAAFAATSRPRLINFLMRLPTVVVLSYILLLKLVEQSLLIGLPKGKGVGPMVKVGPESETEPSVEKGNLAATDIRHGTKQ